MQFAPKTTTSSLAKTVTPVLKLTFTVTIIDVQDGEEVVTVDEDDEVALTEDKNGNLFQDISSEDELGNK